MSQDENPGRNPVDREIYANRHDPIKVLLIKLRQLDESIEKQIILLKPDKDLALKDEIISETIDDLQSLWGQRTKLIKELKEKGFEIYSGQSK